MKTGDTVLWGGCQFQILAEYDDEYVYLSTSHDGAALVHKSELTLATIHQVQVPIMPAGIFVYLDVGNNGAQLVSVSELSQVTTLR